MSSDGFSVEARPIRLLLNRNCSRRLADLRSPSQASSPRFVASPQLPSPRTVFVRLSFGMLTPRKKPELSTGDFHPTRSRPCWAYCNGGRELTFLKWKLFAAAPLNRNVPRSWRLSELPDDNRRPSNADSLRHPNLDIKSLQAAVERVEKAVGRGVLVFTTSSTRSAKHREKTHSVRGIPIFVGV